MRYASLDGLRGSLLLLMMWAHLKTPIPSKLAFLDYHLVSYADAAHGFVFLSGIVVGMYFTRVAVERGERRLWGVARKRLASIYTFHAATILILWCSGKVAAEPSGLLAHFPTEGSRFVGLLGLADQPVLLDILPMYLVFIAVSPACVRLFIKGRSAAVLLASASLWLLSQFGFPQHLGRLAAEHLAYPYGTFGAFHIVAWQIIYVVGLFVGYSVFRGGRLSAYLCRLPNSGALLLAGSVTIIAAAKLYLDLMDKYIELPVPAAIVDLLEAQSKWSVSPIYLVSLAANAAFLFWLYNAAPNCGVGVVERIGRNVQRILQGRILVQLGQASVVVFSAHILIVYAMDHFYPAEELSELSRYVSRWAATATLLVVPVVWTATKAGILGRAQREGSASAKAASDEVAATAGRYIRGGPAVEVGGGAPRT